MLQVSCFKIDFRKIEEVRNIDPLFPLVMHSLVDACKCPDPIRRVL